MKLIDKDTLVAEIEILISNGQTKLKESEECNDYESYVAWAERIATCINVLSLLDTLEVKEENDLENLFQALPENIVDEKSHQVYELSIYHYDDQCIVDYVGEIDHDSLYTFSGNTLYEAIGKAWNWIRKNSTGGLFMTHCNLEMDDNCYGCPYYGSGDIEGCKLTIKFHKKFPNGDDKQYEQYLLSNGRIKISQ